MIFLTATSCAPSELVNDTADGEYSHLFSRNSKASQTAFQETLASFDGSLGWPARPRRTADFTDFVGNESSLGIGAEFNFFGSKAASTIDAKFGFNYRSNLLLIRTSRGGIEGITKEADPETGNIYLNVEDGVDFVGLCAYEAGLHTGLNWSNKVKFFGNGFGNSTDIGSTIAVNQSSFFFKVRKTDTVQTLRQKCMDDFKRRVKPSVIADLSRIATASIFQQESDATEMEKAAAATLYGPRIRGISAKGHKWTIYQASFSSNANVMTIKQTLRRWRHMSTGVDRHYTIKIKEGQIISEEFSDGTEIATKELARELAAQVFIEYSQPYVPEDVEPYMLSSRDQDQESDAFGQISKGESFSDSDYLNLNPDKKITKIFLKGTDDRVMGMAYRFEDDKTIYRGWDAGSEFMEYQLDSNEHIKSIDLSLGNDPHLRIYSIKFTTTTGRVFGMGIETMDRHFIAAPKGKYIKGFYGRTTDTLDQIGAIFGDLFPTEVAKNPL